MRTTDILFRLVFLAWLATASPTSTFGLPPIRKSPLQRRELISDVCDLGYCTKNSGTTGGSGGNTVVVSSLADFSQAVQSRTSTVVMLKGQISGAQKVDVLSDKTIIGLPGSALVGIGLNIEHQTNVIIRNMKMSNVLATHGDAISIRSSNNVWVDHCDLSSDVQHGKDYYDGLLDVSHGSDWVTVSNTFFHDHYKTSLVGHSDRNGAEDTGHLHITYANNYWNNTVSRTPSIRFGTAHILNSYYANIPGNGVNTRMGAQVLIESTVFDNVSRPVDSVDSSQKGSAALNDVDLGGSSNLAPSGEMSAESVGYEYELLGAEEVKDDVIASSGQILEFGQEKEEEEDQAEVD